MTDTFYIMLKWGNTENRSQDMDFDNFAQLGRRLTTMSEGLLRGWDELFDEKDEAIRNVTYDMSFEIIVNDEPMIGMVKESVKLCEFGLGIDFCCETIKECMDEFVCNPDNFMSRFEGGQ